METFIIHPRTEVQKKAVIAVLDALKVRYEPERDETAYIMSSSAMVERLDRSIQQAKEGKVTAIKTEDLWK